MWKLLHILTKLCFDSYGGFMISHSVFFIIWSLHLLTSVSCWLAIDALHSSCTREFVNSVWCIKILSPPEVQQMGKRGNELLNSVPIQRLSNSSCDDYATRQDSRNLSSGITSVGSLDF